MLSHSIVFSSGKISCQRRSTKGSDYQGLASTTVDGDTCQQWSLDDPQAHNNNYCRNPDGDPGVWCYTTTALKSSYILRRFTFNF